MQLNTMAAALATAGLVAGCGFTPKKPPSPTDGPRIPINRTAPNPRPWSAPPTSLPISPNPAAENRTMPQTAGESATGERHDSPQDTKRDPAPTVSTEPKSHDPLPLFPVSPRLEFDTTLFVWPEPQTAQVPDVIAQAAATSVATFAAAEPYPQASPAEPQAVEVAVAIPVQATQTEGPAIRTEPEPTSTDAVTAPAPAPADASPADRVVPLDNASTPQSPAPTTSASPAEPAPPVSWSAQKGTRLSDMLAEWGTRENWTVRWNTSKDFRIEADFSIDAPNFLSAAGQILKAYRDAGQPFHPAAYSNQVLVITTTE